MWRHEMSRGHFFLFCWNERFWVKTRAIMAFGQKKKKEKQEAVFSVFLPLLKALSDDICLTLKLKNSFNPFLRQPLWRHNFAFCFQQRWHLSGVVWSHCDWIHNISQFIFFQQRLIVRARGVDLTNFKIFWSNSPGWEMKGQSKAGVKGEKSKQTIL